MIWGYKQTSSLEQDHLCQDMSRYSWSASPGNTEVAQYSAGSGPCHSWGPILWVNCKLENPLRVWPSSAICMPFHGAHLQTGTPWSHGNICPRFSTSQLLSYWHNTNNFTCLLWDLKTKSTTHVFCLKISKGGQQNYFHFLIWGR